MPPGSAAVNAIQSQLLVIEADAARAGELRQKLTEALAGQPVIHMAASGREASDLLRQSGFAVVLADLESLSDLANATEEAVARLVRIAQGALFLALADGGSVSRALAAMRAGAHDYIARPIDGAHLASRLHELAARHGKTGAGRLEPHGRGISDFAGFIGGSSAMQFVYEQIERIAPSRAPVFITGESGTGKDVCAQALHRRGPRADQAFIAINCAAVPRELIESELFGTVRGAFTGAHDERVGAAERADRGTLFLDEIGEMDLSLQTKLLRFLQTDTMSRLGDSTQRRLDVRVICATGRNPMQLIADRVLREDLFYRLHVLPIHLPPLRQRPADIVPLANHFLHKFAREEHKGFSGFTADAASALTAQDWPGNVRQLQNLMRRLVVLHDGGEIDQRMLARAALDLDAAVRRPATAQTPGPAAPRILPMWRQEQQIIEEAIALCNGNVSLAAAALEISPSTIYRKRQSWADMAATG